MSNALNTISLVLLLSQSIFSTALRTEVIVYKLSGFESLFSGSTKTINMNNSISLSEVSVFGWIKMSYSGAFKEILELKTATDNQSYSANPIQDLIFYLQYLNWGTSKLKFGCYTEDKEEYSFFDLSEAEDN